MNKQDLITRGYFPKELPPPFKTASLAAFAAAHPSFQISPKSTCKLYSHSLARHGSLRRKLSLPNPILFLEITKIIETYWGDIQSLTRRSRLSKSQPIHTPHPKRSRSISPMLDFSDLPRERARNRAIGLYVLQADISQFYQSIYTHSIPWAIHGKEFSKKAENRNNSSLFGTQLDKLIRNSQDGQTMGIPIGSDTSLIIAELILCAADVKLIERITDAQIIAYRGFRYSDDYELVFSSRSEAETALSYLQQVLSDFELTLNPDKTRIIELPCSLDASWALELTNYKFSGEKSAQMQDIIRYFNRAFQISKEFSREPVLKYAVSRIGKFEGVCQDNWTLLESLLLQSITVEPSITRDALSILFDLKKYKNYSIDVESLEVNLNSQIIQHSQLGHSSEVAWSIWSIIVFELTISEQAAQAISEMEDSIVAILALDAQRRGRINLGLNTKKWEQFLSRNELYGRQWLFSYEASVQEYFPKAEEYLSKDPYFSKLREYGVTFYDCSVELTIPPGEISGPSGEIQVFGIHQ